MMKDVKPHHRVRLSIDSHHLGHEVWIPFMTPEQLTADRVMIEVDRVVQSNDTWMFDEFFINFIHAPLPAGGGRKRGIGSLEQLLQQKQCFIQIPDNGDNLCCAKAIVTGIARIEKHPDWNSIRLGRKKQSQLATELHIKAKVPVGALCGKPEWEKFQQVLDSQYQLVVLSKEFFNAIIYSGRPANHQIYLYLTNNHFSLITTMKGFLCTNYYCTSCHKGYQNPGSHQCPTQCKYCQQNRICSFEGWQYCSSCHRHFVSDSCMQGHKANGLCHYLKSCEDCGQTYHSYRKHNCGYHHCKQCKEEVPKDHKCYIKPINQKKCTEQHIYIFYDFECMLGAENQHVPNLCVANKVCSQCMTESITAECCNCDRQQSVFRGENTLKNFGDWVFSGKFKGSILMAHNNSHYDLHLIMNYVHDNGLKPEIIQNGKKILCMKTCGLTFIDSLNFFPMPLAKLPNAFGLQELSKGFFPHLFSTVKNQSYIGPIPDASFYDPDSMSREKREEFNTWYAKQSAFNFQEDLLKYCASDVDILQRCCGIFRKNFRTHTGGIEPFMNSITIASACNQVYRTLFLEREEIAIIPPHGYDHDRQSSIALCWLDWWAQQNNVQILHASNGPEVKLAGYKVDGFDPKNNTVLQFHGCFWHACPKHYSKHVVHPTIGLTMEEIHLRTMKTTATLQQHGFQVIEMWECDFKTEIADNPQLKEFYECYEAYERLQPRDAFTGGRCNAITLYYSPQPGEMIRYVDYTSLYPYICKYGLFPIGHPEIYIGDKIPSKVCGLMKCKVLPPPQLFHPVLPYRARGKLLFPLCRTCAKNNFQGKCPHEDPKDRALTGTWVTLELDKAVSLGYVIVQKYEAWHFPFITKYDSQTKKGGLWASCINLWLKEKQQADGWPSWVKTDEDKQKYVEDYSKHEGIQLDPSRIERNEGLRSLSKLMLNAHWGKFGQNPCKSKLTYISEPKKYIDMMTDETIEVSDLTYVNEEFVAIKWTTKEDFIQPLPNTNVVLAAFTTAQARLKLYELLEPLQERALYMDTDSCIYIHREGCWNPPLGDYLGDLKDETKGMPITKYVGGGPKNYAYELKDGSTVCKVKGFTLNHQNAQIINLESMLQLVTSKEDKHLTIKYPHQIVRKNGHLFSEPQEKSYKLIYDKRVIGKNYVTYPFGYK